MQILECHCVPNSDGAMCIIEGEIFLDESEVVKASDKSGRHHGNVFEDYIKDLICHQLKTSAKYPSNHDIMAASLFYQFGTNFQKWKFSIVTLTRFR